MIVIYLAVIGIGVFAIAAGLLGAWLRRNPSKTNAESSSRIMHFLFFTALGTPFLIAMFYPGLTHLDEVAGWQSLPFTTAFRIIGIILGIPGLYLLGISNKLLRALGSGANAFRLTKHVVGSDIYRQTRNPMSLGYYLAALSLGLVAGSTVLTLMVVMGLIPAHVFFLKYFEETELELRLGDPYKEYKRSAPFLLPRFSAK